MASAVGKPRDERTGNHRATMRDAPIARRTHRATNSHTTRTTMRDVVYRVTYRLYDNRM
jgi:hypothetical protein